MQFTLIRTVRFTSLCLIARAYPSSSRVHRFHCEHWNIIRKWFSLRQATQSHRRHWSIGRSHPMAYPLIMTSWQAKKNDNNISENQQLAAHPITLNIETHLKWFSLCFTFQISILVNDEANKNDIKPRATSDSGARCLFSSARFFGDAVKMAHACDGRHCSNLLLYLYMIWHDNGKLD